MKGIKVLDLTQIYNGPYATFLMAMNGANVIKVEPPGGEYLRRRDASSGALVPFAMLNACKKSISLNLKTRRGRELFLDLVETADVVAENYTPGVMDRLGIGYEELRKRNPGIILASGSGYGQDGGYRDHMAMDLTVQAMSGVMSVTGYADGTPTKSGAALCDFSGGTHLYGAICTALFRRERTGEGAKIDVSMLESIFPFMASNIGMLHGARNNIPLRTGNRHGGLSLCPYNVYPTNDGYIAIICNTDKHWTALARAMEKPELARDEKYANTKNRVANMDDVDGMVAEFTSGFAKNDLYQLLQDARVPAAPVRDLTETMEDPVLKERGYLVEVDHPDVGSVTLIRSPIRLADTEQAIYENSPSFGRDNEAIYGELGLDADAIQELVDDGVV